MKALVIFASLVLGYTTITMVHVPASASSYRAGIEAYIKTSGRMNSPMNAANNRSPSIVSNK